MDYSLPEEKGIKKALKLIRSRKVYHRLFVYANEIAAQSIILHVFGINFG
jgi:hypothetical protein